MSALITASLERNASKHNELPEIAVHQEASSAPPGLLDHDMQGNARV
jgi:hypothetical protein